MLTTPHELRLALDLFARPAEAIRTGYFLHQGQIEDQKPHWLKILIIRDSRGVVRPGFEGMSKKYGAPQDANQL